MGAYGSVMSFPEGTLLLRNLELRNLVCRRVAVAKFVVHVLADALQDISAYVRREHVLLRLCESSCYRKVGTFFAEILFRGLH